MSKILPSYKKSIIEELINSISTNTSNYYIFGANPIEFANTIPTIANNESNFSYEFINRMIFGKKITKNDIYPIINSNLWESNTVYQFYDQTSNTLYSNNNYYVVSDPNEVGGVYNVYKCIDNNNGANSTVDPGTIGTPSQPTTFQTVDGYKWRYVTTVSATIYNRFFSDDYMPIYANNILVASANNYAGVEKIIVSNTGTGYSAYTNGIIQSIVNSTLIQIEAVANPSNFYYNNNAIYMYNSSLGTAQLSNVSNYIVNSTGNWVILEKEANTTIILPSQTEYLITPKLVFDTDGDTFPIGYAIVNTSINAISGVQILDIGSNITRANVYIESSFGSGANIYAIVPPPGGHGSDPVKELNVKGFVVGIRFSNNENSTIVTSNTVYNKIGIIKNPYILETNNTKGALYTANTFDSLLKFTVSPSHTFTLGETVIGSNSKAQGIVVFSNSTQTFLTGEKQFQSGEYVGNTSVGNVTVITIISRGDIYTKDLSPLYVNNINNVNRSNTQTETFKIFIQV